MQIRRRRLVYLKYLHNFNIGRTRDNCSLAYCATLVAGSSTAAAEISCFYLAFRFTETQPFTVGLILILSRT
jgi:hypothetical protein